MESRTYRNLAENRHTTETRQGNRAEGLVVRRNDLKRRVLGSMDGRGWMSPATVAVLVGMYPTRGMYGYLKRLHRWGLLDRRRDARGLLIYKLSQRGSDRLAWLSRAEI